MGTLYDGYKLTAPGDPDHAYEFRRLDPERAYWQAAGTTFGVWRIPAEADGLSFMGTVREETSDAGSLYTVALPYSTDAETATEICLIPDVLRAMAVYGTLVPDVTGFRRQWDAFDHNWRIFAGGSDVGYAYIGRLTERQDRGGVFYRGIAGGASYTSADCRETLARMVQARQRADAEAARVLDDQEAEIHSRLP